MFVVYPPEEQKYCRLSWHYLANYWSTIANTKFYLVKCCGNYHYLSSKKQCGDYLNLTTTRCSKTTLQPLFQNRSLYHSRVAIIEGVVFN